MNIHEQIEDVINQLWEYLALADVNDNEYTDACMKLYELANSTIHYGDKFNQALLKEVQDHLEHYKANTEIKTVLYQPPPYERKELIWKE